MDRSRCHRGCPQSVIISDTPDLQGARHRGMGQTLDSAVLIFMKQGMRPQRSTRPLSAGSRSPSLTSQLAVSGSQEQSWKPSAPQMGNPFSATRVWSERWSMDAKETNTPPAASHRSFWRNPHIQAWVPMLWGAPVRPVRFALMPPTPFTTSMSFGQTPPTANTSHIQFRQPPSPQHPIQDLHAPRHPSGPSWGTQ